MSMQNEMAQEQISVDIDEAKKVVALKESVLKLTKNRDFISIVEDGYFQDEASRLVLLKADPQMQTKEKQKALNKSIDAIGYFRQYLGAQIQMGSMAEKALADDEQTREELAMESD